MDPYARIALGILVMILGMTGLYLHIEYSGWVLATSIIMILFGGSDDDEEEQEEDWDDQDVLECDCAYNEECTNCSPDYGFKSFDYQASKRAVEEEEFRLRVQARLTEELKLYAEKTGTSTDKGQSIDLGKKDQ